MNHLSCTVMYRLYILCFLLLAWPSALSGQTTRNVQGLVTNDKGEILIGVNVRVKGSNTGVTTNTEGRYQLAVPGSGSILVFSFVGYTPQELPVGNRNTIDLQLTPSAKQLQDLVVVGYGTQKKINLTGAVDQVGSEVFQNRPLTNVTRGLQGVIPNLNIRMTDGKPTRSATYNVRGTTSIGAGGSALVLIDGVPGEPSLLNPNDIESVTVLKDAAAAAIYGSRGSFGVILITTKSPAKDRTTLNYSSNYSINERTIKPKMVTNGYQWAKNFDDAFTSWNDYASHPQKANSVFPFSLDYLDELKRRNDDPSLPKTDINPTTGEYVYYGNTDWLKELYADNTPSMEHNLSLSGSAKNVSYYLSGRYMSQDGIFRYNPDDFKTYNLRARGSVQALSWLKVENDLNYTQTSYFYPILNHPSNTPVWRRISDEAFPIAMLRNPDGTLTENASIVFGSFISGNNQSELSRVQIRNTSRFTATFFKNKVHVNGDLTFWRLNDVETRIYTPVPYSKKPDVRLERGESKMNENDDKTNYLAANFYADYEHTYRKHYFKVMAGYNYENSLLKSRYIQRDGIINNELPDFSLTNGLNFTMRGGGNEWRTLGGFFRINYNFDERYLLEVNGRYDGTSKFPQTQQWGFFPSASAGWRVSKEKFWKIPYKAISDMKLRASYGTLGNGNISPYQFLETMSVTQMPRILNGIRPDYTQQPNVIPNGLTWEKATTLNLGTDLALLNNRLTITADWYTRKTKDMFTDGLPLPGVFGATEPKGNYADLKTTGWELSIGWRNKTGGKKPFSYDVRLVLSDNKSVITRFNNPLGLINTYYEGMQIGDIWGFVNDGYFRDQHEIDTRGIDQSFIRVSAANKILPGDIKFKDLNNDRIINEGAGSLSDPGDKTVIGNSSPRYMYGFTGNMDWNNIFVSFFFQGIGKRDFWPGADNSLFWGPYNRPYSWQPVDVMNKVWSEENPDAYFPRMRGYTALNSRAELQVTQSRYLQNAAYLRLKNITLGYNLPASLVNKAGMANARIYVTGQNLWTWSPMYKYVKTMDPEVIEGSDPELNDGAGNGMSYPMLKTYTIGINVTFK
ncbi:TonB-dependent receptor [Chitinophaga agrisoli]|uniref:TonB-dependent receptor n=2 Tax=Chitinophaga agrisoli TaxID=2607653 RepID=A0A5B2VIP6_9BACT|nr:TonB-dependent receptor [Chitinophaga agrisoli]